jgi:hypothetical protein
MWKFRAAVVNLTTPSLTVRSAMRVLNLKDSGSTSQSEMVLHREAEQNRCCDVLPNVMTYRPEDSSSLLITTELVKVANDSCGGVMWAALQKSPVLSQAGRIPVVWAGFGQ